MLDCMPDISFNNKNNNPKKVQLKCISVTRHALDFTHDGRHVLRFDSVFNHADHDRQRVLVQSAPQVVAYLVRLLHGLPHFLLTVVAAAPGELVHRYLNYTLK
jgi:hypothetical protein